MENNNKPFMSVEDLKKINTRGGKRLKMYKPNTMFTMNDILQHFSAVDMQFIVKLAKNSEQLEIIANCNSPKIKGWAVKCCLLESKHCTKAIFDNIVPKSRSRDVHFAAIKSVQFNEKYCAAIAKKSNDYIVLTCLIESEHSSANVCNIINGRVTHPLVQLSILQSRHCTKKLFQRIFEKQCWNLSSQLIKSRHCTKTVYNRIAEHAPEPDTQIALIESHHCTKTVYNRIASKASEQKVYAALIKSHYCTKKAYCRIAAKVTHWIPQIALIKSHHCTKKMCNFIAAMTDDIHVKYQYNKWLSENK